MTAQPAVGDTHNDPLVAVVAQVHRHPKGCAFCPLDLLGVERDSNGDPLCQTCPHRSRTL